MPIQKKLMRFIFLISGIVLLVTCIAFFVYELYTFRESTIEKISTIGKIISTNSTAALAFDNHEDAKEILAALKAESHIVAACLYDKNGHLFSRYPSGSDSSAFPVKPGPEGYRFAHSNLELFQPVMQETRRLGTLYLRSDLGAMYERFRLYGIVVAFVIAISFILAYLFSKTIQNRISKPILTLADTAKVISEKGDYSLRATRLGEDELGSLTDAFNYMLVQIQAKNQELYDFTQNLEQKVIERTNALATKNQLLTSISKINDSLSGIKEVAVLAQDIIHQLADCLDAQIGTIYVKEGGNELKLAAGYAFSRAEQENSVITIGEGLVGQAALDKRSIILSPVPDNYIKVNSSLGNSSPKNIIVHPFLYEEQVIGVIEIGSIHEFSDLDMELLNLVGGNIGIAFNSSQSRMQLKQLLEKTQKQTEELAGQKKELNQQREELHIINENLEKQAQALKHQQEELQMTNEELEEQTHSLELKNQEAEAAKTEIEDKTKQLEASNKYKSEFLANMSHELRTPLNSLLILSKDLLENKKGNLDTEQVESAEIIHKSGHDLLTLINEVLDLSKIEAGKMLLNIGRVVLKEFMNGLVLEFKRQVEQKGLELTSKIDNALPPFIRTDSQRLNQIVKNLLSNAVKFTEKGSITISMQRHMENKVVISITDTGIGIKEDKQLGIFEAFQQAEGGTSRKYGGTGLGLSISRELATLLGAEIKLSSKLNQGSTFSLIIPIESPDLDGPVEISAPDEPVWDKSSSVDNVEFLNRPAVKDDRATITNDDKIVLIIEDDLRFASIVLNLANSKGFKCLSAATGEDGLVLARKYKPHAIILDLNLPGIKGQKVLTELKSDPEIRHIPVHVISATERSLAPIREGAVEFLMKPIGKKELEEAFNRIRSFIGRKMKNLLIIEDDENARKTMRKLIGTGDVNCYESGTGKEALITYERNDIDCIVLDLGLPDMSGFDLIHKFGKLKGHALPPIIIYTGKELTKEENDELEKYAANIIIKGVRSGERLLDETALFLHRTVSDLPKSNQLIINNRYDTETIFRGKRIVLVDDDMRNVFALSKILTQRGMEIIKAENGLNALEILDTYPHVDLVLMDIMMPEMDGYETMKEIRKQQKFKNLPIIALTAKAMKDDKQKCIEAGANDYIAKPIEVEYLLSVMRVWLSK